LPKDHENIPLPDWTVDEVLEKAAMPFAPDQMIRCDNCLRSNPPTRVNCLYCSAPLTHDEQSLALQKPSLRPLEKWERGYNNILLCAVANLPVEKLAESAELLRVREAELSRILSSPKPLPLARTATVDEARLIERRLQKLDIPTAIMPERDVDAIRIRALELGESLTMFQQAEGEGQEIQWTTLELIVKGRLTTKRVEIREQRKRVENSIVDSSQFVTDEVVMDFYAGSQLPFRIMANSFDFNCLGPNKTLVAAENLTRLVEQFCLKAPQATFDESFNSQRKLLDLIWPPEQSNQSSGWRRERPSKYSLGSATEVTNHEQFARYSQMLRFAQERQTEPIT
jgi:hypothetical protein